MFAARRDRLLAQLRSEGLDAVLITHPINVTYLTGFTGDSTYLLVSPAKTLIVSDGRFTTQLEEECPGLETSIRPPVQPLIEAAAAAVGQLGVASVGFESNQLTVAEFESLSERIALAPGEGLPGRVLVSGEPIWVVDPPSDANFPRRDAALRSGLKAAFGFPLLSYRGVVGVREAVATGRAAARGGGGGPRPRRRSSPGAPRP